MVAGVAVGCLAVLLALTFEPVRSLILRGLLWLWKSQKLTSTNNQNQLSNRQLAEARKHALEGNRSASTESFEDGGASSALKAQISLIVAEQLQAQLRADTRNGSPAKGQTAEALAVSRTALSAAKDTQSAVEALEHQVASLHELMAEKTRQLSSNLPQHDERHDVATLHDVKAAYNRLRAEIAAAKQESIELRELRKDVEATLTQLRRDIEIAGDAKKAPLAHLRAEVEGTNKAVARLENEVQRLDSKVRAQVRYIVHSNLNIFKLKPKLNPVCGAQHRQKDECSKEEEAGREGLARDVSGVRDEMLTSVSEVRNEMLALQQALAAQDASYRDLRAHLDFQAMEMNHTKQTMQLTMQKLSSPPPPAPQAARQR